jgi:hypothetical protein
MLLAGCRTGEHVSSGPPFRGGGAAATLRPSGVLPMVSLQNASGVLPRPGAAGRDGASGMEGLDEAAAYGLYYGPAPRRYTHVLMVTTNVCTLAALPLNAPYYCAVTAVTSEGMESDFSAEFAEWVWCWQVTEPPATGWQVQASPDLLNWSACDGCQFLGTNADQSLNWSMPLPTDPQHFYRLAGTHL